MRLSGLVNGFFDSDKSGGLLLISATIFSLTMANSGLQAEYIQLWHFKIYEHSLVHWINDGLMAIFFLLVGLELKREILAGKLSNLKSASFPVVGAIGGMLVPAAIFTLFNFGTPGQTGVGIPMATDIAFAVGILSILGKRVPLSLKIFLTALAVVDDMGAILVIAVFYSKTLDIQSLVVAFSIFGVLFLFNRFKIYNLIPYIIGGISIWYFMLNSGIHATFAGIMLAAVIPFEKSSVKTPSVLLEHVLHKPVAFAILPFFAVANTSIGIGGNWASSFGESYCLGIMSGLVFGKPLGIFLFTYLGSKVGVCKLPSDLRWRNILGVGFLGGIGFTMSIFITILAYDNLQVIDNAKIAILSASFVSAIIGLTFLSSSLKTPKTAG